MADPLSVGEVAALLLDERKYERPLTRWEFHKLMYLTRKELENIGVDAEIPYFWYKFGTMTPTADTGVTVVQSEEGPSEVRCEITPASIDLPEEEMFRARLAVSRALNTQYELGTDGLTDLMYQDAPYEAQRHFRRLKKQLDTLVGEREYEIDTSKSSIRETLFAVVESFPVEEVSSIEADLLRWYSLISAELDAIEFSPTHAKSLTEDFWTIFAIELAQRHNTGLELEEIVATLNTDKETFLAYADEKSERLRTYDRERRRHTEVDEELEKVASVTAASHPDVPVR